MFLKELTKKGFITIDYKRDGLSQSIRGRVYRFDLSKQTLLLKDENQQIFSIRLSSIKKIS
jgi:hypothetical protein